MATMKPLDKASATPQPPIVVKKYANRRLYNTSSSSYVTLEELALLLRAGKDFVVFDAKSGEEITRSVLTQIILEEDSKGRNLLPVGLLRQLIGFYDDNMQSFLPRYLEMSMEHYMQNQEQMQRYFEGTMGRFFPVGQLNDMTRQNMALWQQAASMFAPFPSAKGGAGGTEKVDPNTPPDAEAIKRQIAALQAELERLEGTPPKAKAAAKQA
ncbi:MAG: polyhydroxyalkanoate synthesis repressor PhaR [Geminicoccaceae bacterium]|nr:MAG: polyhydroxyalkanoate synthesis repressor PhaR [Geminicoccaceae bacterium]